MPNFVPKEKSLSAKSLKDSVRVEGLEPPCLAAPDPKSGTSTNFATRANPNRYWPAKIRVKSTYFSTSPLSMRSFLLFVSLLCLLTACSSSRKGTGGQAVSKIRRQIVADAKAQLGRPYKWGGGTPNGFDCSGLVQFVYSKYNIQLPRTTAGLATAGREVSLKKLQSADLLIFRGSDPGGPVGHVGIVLHANGEDTEFIHASTSKKGGGVIVSALSQEYYKRRLVKAISVVEN